MSQKVPFKRRFSYAKNVAKVSSPLLLALMSTAGSAASLNWTNPGVGDWSVGSNWNTGTTPAGGDSVSISNGGTAQVSNVNINLTDMGVGINGSGFLELDNSSVNSSSFNIGTGASGQGNVTVNNNSDVKSGSYLNIGFSGKGSLVLNSGTVAPGTNYGVRIGVQAGSEGEVIVNGGTLLGSIGEDNFVVGRIGKGTLTVNNNGQVKSTWVFVGGEYRNGVLQSSAGEGKVVLNDNAYFESDAGIVIGGKSGSGDILLNDASTMKTTGSGKHVYVGYEGVGNLTVNDSAILQSSGNTYIGTLNGSQGNVTVNGGQVNVGSTLMVGSGGTGSLDVNGGTVAVANQVGVGVNANTQGALTVFGGRMFATGGFVAGINGSGVVNANGGVLETSNNITLGNFAAGQGTLNVGGGTVKANNLYVGLNGTGIANVNSGYIEAENAVNIGVTTSATGVLSLNGGVLATKQVSGGSGSSELVFNGGTLKALDHNADFIQDVGSLEINTGGGTIDTDVYDISFNQLLTGVNGGTLTKAGSGTLTLDTVNAFNGLTNVQDGKLVLGSSASAGNAFLAGGVRVQNGAVLAGNGIVGGNLEMVGGGAVSPGNDSIGTLTIQGDYHGQNGSVVMIDSVLGNDASLTDRLVIDGNATGQSSVAVNNMGGSGALTVKGIEVISIAGNSDATFNLSGRAVAGAYEYNLRKGSDGGWYLRSDVDDVDPGIGGGAPGIGGGAPGIDDGAQTLTPLYRAEVGAYLANAASANTLFSHQLSDRTYYQMDDGSKQLWVRVFGQHGQFRDSTDQLKTKTNSQAFQAGSDLFVKNMTDGSVLKSGVMAGYGHTKGTARGYQYDANATATGNGYAVGVYGTWLKDMDSATQAPYIDAWAQYVHFKNKVQGDYLQTERYTAKGLLASVEAGYNFKLAEKVSLQPQAQVTWMNVKSGEHIEANGTRVKQGGNGNIQTRLGAKVVGEFGDSEKILLKPYAQMNWLHNSKTYYVDMDGVKVNQRGAKNIAQLQLGLEAKITPSFKAWGNVSYGVGKNDYRNGQVNIGLKYTF